MEKTAVDFLAQYINPMDVGSEMEDIIAEASDIFRKQIQEAFFDGHEEGDYKGSEQYFEEKYGQ